MARSKGLGNVSAESVGKGELHSVQIDYEKTLVQNPNLTTEHLKEVLNAGYGVVSPEFAEVLRSAKKHKVYTDKMIDERHSAHQVTFGIFVGERTTKKGNHVIGKTLSAAMKPFGEPEHAVNEYLGYQVLQRLGIETFQPVGVFPSRHHNNFVVVTKTRGDIIGLELDDWVKGMQPEKPGDVETLERNKQTVKEVAKILAWTHINGVFLPDGQIKNFIATASGQVGVIDTENLKVKPIEHEDTEGLQGEDFTKLIRSFIGDPHDGKIFSIDLFHGFSPDKLQYWTNELIIEPYTLALLQYTMEQGSSVMQADRLDVSARDFLGRQGWSNQQPAA